MRRIPALIFVLALVVAACGDDDSATTTTAVDTTAAPTTTTAAPTTTEATTTTVAPTTVDPTAARVAAAAELVGLYTGEWQNTTFGSAGETNITVEVDEVANVVMVTVDLDGNVFGGADPDPFVLELDLTEDPPYTLETELLGEATLDVDASGAVSLEAPAIPGLGGLPLTVEGSQPGELTYTIGDGEGGVFAEGVVTLFGPRR